MGRRISKRWFKIITTRIKISEKFDSYLNGDKKMIIQMGIEGKKS